MRANSVEGILMVAAYSVSGMPSLQAQATPQRCAICREIFIRSLVKPLIFEVCSSLHNDNTWAIIPLHAQGRVTHCSESMSISLSSKSLMRSWLAASNMKVTESP